ncbi:MAG: bifunctional folylpolyglutamate synthase/dihydrofolate synthase [Bacteroidales bacterium]|nr:bifunctional folylpolyglutamate synthase/dihydrofolate synthase [Bacteroidales bacterium]
MTYDETLDYMYAQLPMYHRIGAAAYKADLAPTEALMAHLGHPERAFRSIHVAGTNGKGSVSHFLASILQEAGLKVGLYTSPHLVDFRERMRIGGEMISRAAVVDFVERNREAMEGLKLSFFEMTVGLAFDWFAREKVDIAVVEVGMGGRLDSTNVITPELSIITNIGLDHTQFLGDTLEKIAAEKAGIIKKGVPVVVGESQEATKPVFCKVAEEKGAPLVFADEHYLVDNINKYTEELTGEYQKKNIATVLMAVEVLRGKEQWRTVLTENAVAMGLAKVVSNTHLRGRWERLASDPLTICETAHNADGIRAMVDKVKQLGKRRVHLVYGCVNDKDSKSILQILQQEIVRQGVDITWYFSQPTVPRRKPVAELVAVASEVGIMGQQFEKVEDAVKAACRAACAAGDGDMVLITGSIFLVADVLAAATKIFSH